VTQRSNSPNRPADDEWAKPETAAPFVEFSGVCVDFASSDGVVKALDHASLTFEEGAFVCIVGPSGCGKTTLLQTLAGFLRPTRGSVRLAGQPIDGPGADRGVVFQAPALFPWMTVAKNAGFGLMIRGGPKGERADAVETYLRMVGLWDFRNRYPYELSGGMQQRLAIVRALINDPKLLLMDEPFGALDALTREQMQEELHSIWRRTKKTIVFITHSVEEAVYLGTRVVVMSPRPGRILESLPLPFAGDAQRHDIREVKSTPEFVAIREHVLGLIWRTAEAR
jgi:ABC-type taurine transport system ATPase subunit